MATQYKELERNKSEGGAKPIEREEPFQQSRFDLFDPFVNCSSSQLKRLGNKGDGGKWICLDKYLQQPGCIIYSLGSRGWYDFEQAMLEATPCEIHTFDCTYDGSALPESGGRHHYHKICVGQPTSAFAKATPDMFKTYSDIMASLSHTRVDLLKIDIEGFEYDVLHEWKPACQLPMQISMEVHYQYLYGNEKKPKNFNNLFWSMHKLSLGELAVWFGHFADLGYGVVSREANLPWGIGCCAEFTFIKVEKPAGC